MFSPVSQRASSEARKTATSATSRGAPILPKGDIPAAIARSRCGSKVGVGKARRKRIHGDGARSEFAREDADELLDGSFAAEIKGGLGEEHLGSTGGNRDDAATVAHAARRLLKREEGAFGIGAEDVIEVGFGGLDQRLYDGDADIGDNDVDRRHLLLGFIEQPANVGNAGDIGLNGDGFAAILADGSNGFLGGFLVADIVDDHGRPVCREPLGDGAADAARTARHERDFAFKRMIHSCPFLVWLRPFQIERRRSMWKLGACY
nr:hypothetical protein [Mesorhizobium sp.]